MFNCIENCAECCGLVGINKDIVKKHEHLKQREVKEVHQLGNEIYAVTKDGLCVFLSKDKRCVIYTDRPKICRDFGTSKDKLLQCPYIKPNGNRRSQGKEKRFIRQLNQRLKSEIQNIETSLKNFL